MSPDQCARALRLADEMERGQTLGYSWGVLDAVALLRELAAEPKRVPLTDEQGIALANSVSPGNDNTWIRDPDQCVLRIVRATEAAHGIVGGGK